MNARHYFIPWTVTLYFDYISHKISSILKDVGNTSQTNKTLTKILKDNVGKEKDKQTGIRE